MEISRRYLLQGAGALLAGTHALAAQGASRRKIRIGLADITIRRELSRDYAGTLNAVKAIGFSHFGFRLGRYSASEGPELSASEKAAMARAAGLELGPVRVSPLIPFAEQVEMARAIGARQLVLSAGRIFFDDGFKPRTPSLGELDALITELDAMGELARKSGIRFAYHNHLFDSTPIEGVHPLRRMIARTQRRNVAFELDLGWAHLAGENIPSLVRLMGPRLLSMHVKDIDLTRTSAETDKFVPAGDGEMDYAALMPQLYKLTRALPMIEIDMPADGLAAAARAFSFIANTLKG